MTDNSQPPGDGTAPPPSTTQTSQSTNQEDPPDPSDLPLRAIQAAENLAQALRQFQPAIQGKNRQPPPPPPPPPPPRIRARTHPSRSFGTGIGSLGIQQPILLHSIMACDGPLGPPE